MKERIIQFGEGNFLRGFCDYFIHKLNEKGLYDGKIVVVQPIANGMVDMLNDANCEYNLFLRGIENGEVVNEHTKITSISRGINPYENYADYLALAKNPDMRFVISNTTEAGIEFIDTDKLTDAPPKAFPAKLTILLYERFKANLGGFVMLSCELIDNNGDELKACVMKYAKLWQLGEAFEAWIENENHFCNTLVDRIVTGYPRDEIKELTEKIGCEDKLIDTAEIFHLWVIAGNFENELPFNKAGYNIVWADSVDLYKKRKVRILNGAHTSLVPYAMLKGFQTVGECMENPEMKAYLKKCMFEEIIPTLDLPKAELESYANSVLERFANPFIKHMLSSIALNTVSKFRVRVMPSIIEYKKRFGKYPETLMTAFDAFYEFYKTDMANDTAEDMNFMKTHTKEEVFEEFCNAD